LAVVASLAITELTLLVTRHTVVSSCVFVVTTIAYALLVDKSRVGWTSVTGFPVAATVTWLHKTRIAVSISYTASIAIPTAVFTGVVFRIVPLEPLAFEKAVRSNRAVLTERITAAYIAARVRIRALSNWETDVTLWVQADLPDKPKEERGKDWVIGSGFKIVLGSDQMRVIELVQNWVAEVAVR
jgi:hypothetical protein